MGENLFLLVGELFTYTDASVSFKPGPSRPGKTVCVRFDAQGYYQSVQRA